MSDEEHARLLAEVIGQGDDTGASLDLPLSDDLTARDLAEVWATTEQTINRWVRAGFPNTLGTLWDNTAWIVEGPRTKRLPVSALDQARLSEAQKTRLLELRRRRALAAPRA